MQLAEIVTRFDRLLDPGATPGDRSLNGLQIGGDWAVERIAFALDARLSVVEEAAPQADLLVVHHGIFWGRPFALTGPAFRLLEHCVLHRLALYAAHLPLDVHAELGINRCWARLLHLVDGAPFAEVGGAPIGACGDLASPTTAPELQERVSRLTGEPALLRAYGSKRVQRVAVIGGSIGPAEVAAARAAGADLLLTGERSLPTDIAAEMEGIHLLFAGHSATEIVGIDALMGWSEKNLGLPAVRIHRPTGV